MAKAANASQRHKPPSDLTTVDVILMRSALNALAEAYAADVIMQAGKAAQVAR